MLKSPSGNTICSPLRLTATTITSYFFLRLSSLSVLLWHTPPFCTEYVVMYRWLSIQWMLSRSDMGCPSFSAFFILSSICLWLKFFTKRDSSFQYLFCRPLLWNMNAKTMSAITTSRKGEMFQYTLTIMNRKDSASMYLKPIMAVSSNLLFLFADHSDRKSRDCLPRLCIMPMRNGDMNTMLMRLKSNRPKVLFSNPDASGNKNLTDMKKMDRQIIENTSRLPK